MKRIFFILALLTSTNIVFSQSLERSKESITEAKKETSNALKTFFNKCILDSDIEDCITTLSQGTNNEFEEYIIGGALYNIDSDKSYELHKQALETKPNEVTFNLEYAIESHRKGEYKTAIKHYLLYKTKNESDYRIDVWLSECYINLGEIESAINHWKASNHSHNHTGIDKAIHTIHGRTDQIKKRSSLRTKVINKDIQSAYELIYLDLNWELDWWNSDIQKIFYEHDIQLIKKTFGKKNSTYLDLKSYSSIKLLAREYGKNVELKQEFLNSKIIINNNRFLPHGKVSSDLLRIALTNNLISDTIVFKNRKAEILKLADTYKDGELLNIYAYLEATVTGRVSESTDKKGWEEYNDERFASSYFIGLSEKNRYNNIDLNNALIDFPNSAHIQWIKLNCALVENLEYKHDLIDLIRKEFTSLGSDRSGYSYGLNSYFHLLENGK